MIIAEHSHLKQFHKEAQLRKYRPVLAVAAGLLALSSCSTGNGNNTSEQRPSTSMAEYVPDKHEQQEETLPDEVASEAAPQPSSAWPSEGVIRNILKRACRIAADQEAKQYPNLWGNGLTELSEEYETAYKGKAYPGLFDMELADACPPYARLTDHGAG